ASQTGADDTPSEANKPQQAKLDARRVPTMPEFGQLRADVQQLRDATAGVAATVAALEAKLSEQAAPPPPPPPATPPPPAKPTSLTSLFATAEELAALLPAWNAAVLSIEPVMRSRVPVFMRPSVMNGDRWSSYLKLVSAIERCNRSSEK